VGAELSAGYVGGLLDCCSLCMSVLRWYKLIEYFQGNVIVGTELSLYISLIKLVGGGHVMLFGLEGLGW